MRLKSGSNIPHALTLPYTTQQAPIKLKLAEGVYNPMRGAMGQISAPRAFGQKNAWFGPSLCHNRTNRRTLFSFWPSETSRNLGFLRGIIDFQNAHFIPIVGVGKRGEYY